MGPPHAKTQAAAGSVAAPPVKPEKATKALTPTTLLDVQEVEWITRELERLLAREQSQSDDGPGAGGEDARAGYGRHRRKRASRLSPPAGNKKGGFLAVADLLGRHAVSMCSGDAVDHSSAAAAAADRGRRRGGFREVDKV